MVKYCKTAYTHSSSFGSVVVKSPGIYRWRFKLVGLPGNSIWRMVLGVWKVSSNNYNGPPVNTYFSNPGFGRLNDNEWGYAFDATAGNLIDKDGTSSDGPTYGKICTTGDVVEIELDLNAFILKYRINEEDMGIAYEKVENTEYRVAMCNYLEDTIVEMMH